MVSLFVCVAAESLCYLRITFAVSLTSHRQILTYFGTFTDEVRTQAFCDDRVLLVFCYSQNVLACEREFVVGCYFPFNDLLTLRTTLRCLCALVNITTDRADKFLYHKINN